MEALIEDENAMDKGVADIVKDHKRKNDDDDDDDDEGPSAGPNQGKQAKRRRTKGSESLKNPSTIKETPKCKAPSKGSKTNKFDWNNPKGYRYPFDLSKPLPLQGPPSHRIVAAEYFFNNDLEYLKTPDPEVKYTTSITKTKVARYKIKGIEDMVPSLWSTIKHGSDQQLYTFKEGDFVDLHLNDIEDMLLIVVQHKLFHLDESDIVDFIMALRMFTRSLILKRRIEDLQLGVKSYQKKLNITKPQKTYSRIKFKKPYTPSYNPPGIVYEDLNKQKIFLQVDELYKFSDGTLKSVRDEMHHRILNFRLDYNTEMPKRKWTVVDQRRSGLMTELIDK
uniref:Uncharacterized protein n=1 Tax=Tanacetum cinerariifolium TaxID=118510 RepID=A0A699HP75_TANCI|nr:hypothetical protein [Tanacetum cinerariifolium]